MDGKVASHVVSMDVEHKFGSSRCACSEVLDEKRHVLIIVHLVFMLSFLLFFLQLSASHWRVRSFGST